MTSKISVLIDVTVDRANQALGNFRTSLADADTATGKFKAGAASAFESVKANAGTLALAGGAALLNFGAKSVDAFQETALAAGELRDKLGLTAEEASRFIEVAGDMGINVADLESTIGRMNREAANAPEKFDAIGAAIVRNQDGTTNTKDTFLSVVDALNQMPDAAQRAKAGQELFGRSWMNIAEMVGQGAEGMQAALDSVETGKVIDDKEVDRARRYRDAIDALRGTYEELAVVIGGELTESLADAAEGVMVLKEALDLIPGGASKLKDGLDFSAGIPGMNTVIDQFTGLNDKLDSVNRTHGTLGESITNLSDEVDDNAAALDRQVLALDTAARQADVTAAGISDLTDEFADLKDEISDENAFLDAADGFDKVRDAAADAYTSAAEGSADAEAKARDYQRAINDQKLEVLGLAEEIGNVPAETTAKIIAALDRGEVDEAERILAQLARARSVVVTTRYVGGYDPNAGIGRSSHTGSRFEAGEAKAIIPGEQIFVPDGPGRMFSPAESQRMLSGAGSTNVQVTVNGTPDIARDTARALDTALWKMGAR